MKSKEKKEYERASGSVKKVQATRNGWNNKGEVKLNDL